MVQCFESFPTGDTPQMAMSAQTNSAVYVVDDDPDVRTGLKHLSESVGPPCVTFDPVREFLLPGPGRKSRCLILHVRVSHG